MTANERAVPPRLAPFLAQWDYIVEVLLERLEGLTDAEYLWEPAPRVWTVREVDGRAVPDAEVWAPTGAAGTPPRTLAWSIGHLGAGSLTRADYLVGSHSLKNGDLTWPMTADAGVTFMRDGLTAWRTGLGQMTDTDLDTVGRSAYPHGLDPTLPLIEIVWWVNKELVFHAGEIWFVRDLYAAGKG
ncbi:MAG TPA: DinB family protein [Candidatus Limnocylindrales bacterium]|nr:DinB family protein [Candidatus Limnocylindrales bacterium]